MNPRQEVNAMDARSDLRQALTDMRFKLGNDDPIMDGQIHRVPLMDDKPGQRSGSYIGYLNQGNGWPYARIENFRTGEVRHWKANGTGRFVSDTEKERLAEEAVRIKEKRLQELQAQYESVAIDCQREYQESVLATQPTPYLQRKGIDGDDFKQLQGVKLDAKGNLIVPLQDAEGKIWSIEKIHANGFKSLAKGGQKSGHFSIIETAAQKDQGLDKASVVLICEGYATGVSLALTLKQPVVMAVDAGNLPGVAKALREKYPDKAFLICGDDDRDNKVNKGREKALEAACIIQKFSYGKSRPYVHSSGISIRVQSLNLIQLSTFSRTRILKSHTLNKRNTDKDGIWNLSGLNIQNVRTAIHLFRTLVQNLHTFIHFSRTQIQNFHSSILKFHSPILKPRFRIQKSRLPVLSLRTRILNFRTRAVENGWHAAVASVQSFRHAIRRSRTAASDFRRRIGRAFRKVVDSKGNLKDEEIRSYDRSFATSHER